MTEKAILERLEALVQLSIPPKELVEKPTNENRILNLCDYNHTREDFARELGKPLNTVDVVLNSLRKSGKIRSLSKDGVTVYVRLRR